MYRIESELKRVPLEDLRPTQMTVGFREVEAKRKSWQDMEAAKRKAAIREEFFPAVKGPKKKYYVLDRHHAALALFKERADDVQVGIIKDLSDLSLNDFWIFLDHYSWLHCYDTKGKRRNFDEIPKRFEDLTDDPYRSLAGRLRDQGGFAKVDVPFLEFLWANHLRTVVAFALLKDEKRSLAKATQVAKSKKCAYLPGWCGKV